MRSLLYATIGYKDYAYPRLARQPIYAILLSDVLTMRKVIGKTYILSLILCQRRLYFHIVSELWQIGQDFLHTRFYGWKKNSLRS